MKQREKTIVVLPAYNAEKTLSRVYQAILKNLVEVILVDDFSNDKTITISKKLGIKTLIHKENLGYGANQKTCYKEALKSKADFIIMLHPDGQYDPSDLTLFIESLKEGKGDLVLGSRFLRNKTCQTPFYKVISIKFITWLFNLILGTSLTDANTGYRGYSRKLLLAIPFEKNGNGFIFDPQFLIQTVNAGFKIHEVPITKYYNQDASSIGFNESLKHGFENINLLTSHITSKSGPDFAKKLKNNFFSRQAAIIFSLVYYIFLPGVSLIYKFQKKEIRKVKKGWGLWGLKANSLEEIKRQF
jgi:glycosyltransferase involved in cell wall biosynthesis